MLLLLFNFIGLRMVDMEPSIESPTLSPLPDLHLLDARDEMNFAEFPIALLSNRRPKGLSMVEYSDTFRDPRTREEVVRRLTIDAPERFGLPTATDDEVLLGLIQLTKERTGFQERMVHFSRYELIRLLGWSDKGTSYKRIEQSLNRWMRVTLDYQNAWWDKTAQSYVTEKFHVLEHVRIYESEKKKRPKSQAILPFSSFTWNEIVFQSFRAGFLKQIDFVMFLGLKQATARRMYRFLDKRFYKTGRLVVDLSEFAFNHVGLTASSCQVKAKNGDYHISQSKIREKLTPGIEELEQVGYIKPVSMEQRYDTQQRGKWKIIFELHEKPSSPIAMPTVTAISDNPLIQQLIERGVTASIAEELTKKHSQERIEEKMEIQDWMSENKSGKPVANPAGWLVRAIEDDYVPPKGFVGKAEQQRREQAARDYRDKLAQAESDKRRKDREERDAIVAERKHIEDYLALLTESQKQELESRAMASADDFQTELCNDMGSTGKMMRELLIRDEVLRVCPIVVREIA